MGLFQRLCGFGGMRAASHSTSEPAIAMGAEVQSGVYACRVIDVRELDGSQPYTELADYLAMLAERLWTIADIRKHYGPPKPQGIPVVVTHEGFYVVDSNGERTASVRHQSYAVLLAPHRGAWEWRARLYDDAGRMAGFTMFDYGLGDRKATFVVDERGRSLVVEPNSRTIDR